jgi:pepF/M3 family oligoendopeptidase
LTTPENPPRWDLTSIFPAFESPEYAAAIQSLEGLLADLEQYCQQRQLNAAAPLGGTDAELAEAITGYLERMSAIQLLYRRLNTYAALTVSVDSYNTLARRKLSEGEQYGVRIQQLSVPFQAWLGRRAERLPALLALGGVPGEHAFPLQLLAEQSRYLMSEPEESLAAELALSGASAWDKLQVTVISQLTVPFELDGVVQKLPVTALINLRGHPDAEVRRRGYEAEMQVWPTVREPLAAALNGAKGAAHTLNLRRGRTDDLHTALDQARIDRPTLEAMLGAMQDAFPAFRRYLRSKAARLGKPALPWYDIFAPMGKRQKQLSFGEARAFVLENFERFSPELSAFARRAFDQGWIDAEMRDGKPGGAFCAGIPAIEESRVMCNFDGSLEQTLTIAHELGHAFHNSCMTGKPPLLRSTPMTLAETASIFCETLATDAALSQVSDVQEELAILESFLNNACQITVDISSRFLFEKEVFERRARAELSADEFCDIMRRAQLATYGDGLDPNYLHPYMWTWKPHYYDANLNYYNFPYSFGLLFGLGLYAIYQERGPAFVPEYKALLASTGQGKAAELAARFGIDIRSPEFWKASLAIIEKRIDRYAEI